MSVKKKYLKSFLTKQFSSYTYLNITQFLGALNDNIYKLLIAFFLIQQLGIESSYIIFSTTGAVFVIPFLLFSSNSGTLADRFSKRNIIVLTKIFELLVMSIGLLAFAFESITISYLTLFMMATQSAVFGPSKYGIIPEIVSTERISRANGLMTTFTFLAIIIGTFLASFITDITSKNFILAALLCTIVSLAGVITSFGIEYTQPSGSSKPFNWRFINDILNTLKMSVTVPSLLPAIFGSSFFMFLGAFVQFNIIPYAVESLHLTDVQGGYLFLLTAFGIGTGSMLAGRISGKTVELGLVPVAATGIAICMFLFDYFSNSIGVIIPIILITGILGGMYAVPLDSYIQVASPNNYRGQFVAATNFLSFLGVLFASGFVFILTALFSLSADQGFTVMGFVTAFVAAFFLYQFFDYIARFGGMILSKLHFSTTYRGADNIPLEPVVYLVHHTAWHDTLLILGAQRRRIRFIIEREKEHKPWIKKIYKFLRIMFIPEIEGYETNQKCFDLIDVSLKKGISVCLFVDNNELKEELIKILASEGFSKVLKDNDAPVIPVKIEKGFKEKQSKIFPKFMSRILVPACLTFERPVRIGE